MVRMISVASIETKKWGFEDVSEELFHPVPGKQLEHSRL